MDIIDDEKKWLRYSPESLWEKLNSSEHILHLYEQKNNLELLLHNYVSDGLVAGDCVIVIAEDHTLHGLDSSLRKNGFDLFELKLKDQLITGKAPDILTMFMINDWPDRVLFEYLIRTLSGRAKRFNRRIRIFGEMVTVLWRDGNKAAALCLEQLWSEYCASEKFRLMCSYPKTELNNKSEEYRTVCSHHTCQLIQEAVSDDMLLSKQFNKAHYTAG
jgi:hypothetical protein